MATEEDDRSAILGTAMEEKWADHGIAKTDNTAQMVQRHLEFGCSVHLNVQCLMIEMKIGPFGHDIERIQKLMHILLPTCSWSA
jgi:hypothetical protein